MKKIAFISAFPPSRDNLGPPTSLPFQLLKYTPKDYCVDLYFFSYTIKPSYKDLYLKDIYSLSLNKIICINSPSWWKKRFYRWQTLKEGFPEGVALFPINQKILEIVNNTTYDAVWLYPYWLINWAKSLKCQKIIVTGPDAATLHSERAIKHMKWSHSNNISREVHRLKQNETLERAWSKSNAMLHFVGKEDVVKFNTVTQTKNKCFFERHPVDNYQNIRQTIDNASSKLSVLITGGAENVYVANYLDLTIQSLVKTSKSLNKAYKFTFLGKKYETVIEQMINAGYETRVVEWANNHGDELTKHHIQIFPIAVGSGTKGKVLQALATGLLGLGTWLSFENIEAKKDEDFILFEQPKDIPDIMLKIIQNKNKFAKIAANGKNKIRKTHSAKLCAHLFWSHYR